MFKNRQDAGKQLAKQLEPHLEKESVILGLARGGVVVARAVADALHLPLDVVVIKKISPPFNPELALGAIAPDGVRWIDYRFAQSLGIDDRYLSDEITHKSELVKQNMQMYRKGRSPIFVKNKTVIMVDDGAATGATMQAAVRWVRTKQPKKIIIGLPVSSPDTIAKLKPEVSEIVVLETPENLGAVGEFYERFDQVEDGEVIETVRR